MDFTFEGDIEVSDYGPKVPLGATRIIEFIEGLQDGVLISCEELCKRMEYRSHYVRSELSRHLEGYKVLVRVKPNNHKKLFFANLKTVEAWKKIKEQSG